MLINFINIRFLKQQLSLYFNQIIKVFFDIAFL